MFVNNIDWSNIKIIEFYGLRRSGNHAILSWLMNNLNTDGTGPQDPEVLIAPFPKIGFLSQRVGDVYHINDVTSSWSMLSPKYVRGLMEAYASMGAKTIILSYEDTDPRFSLRQKYPKIFHMLNEDTEKWAALRNWNQVLASRAKGASDERRKKVNLKINFNIIKAYYVTVFDPSIKKIHFDSWVKYKEYRDLFSKSENLTNLDHTSHVSNAGGGSSFNGGDVTKRKVESIPEDWNQFLEEYEKEIKACQEKIDEYISFKP